MAGYVPCQSLVASSGKARKLQGLNLGRYQNNDLFDNHPSASDDRVISSLRAVEFPIKSDWTVAFTLSFLIFPIILGRYFHEPITANAIALNDL